MNWTEQTSNVFACGLHVLSHIYLTSKGLGHTHIFDNRFVDVVTDILREVTTSVQMST